MLLELALALPQPGIPALPSAPHDLLRIEPQRQLLARLRRGLGGRLEALLLAPRLVARPAEELAPALGRAQLLGQLVASRIAELFVLCLVDRPRLGDDLPG